MLLVDVDSGTKNDRENYKILQEKIQDHGDRLTIVVTRLDRLTRSLPELRRFVELIEKTGTKLIALDDHLDLTSSVGRFQLNMLGALAEMESDRMGERIRHGHAFSRSQGKPPPGTPPFGYRRKGDRLEFDLEKVVCYDGQEWSRWELARLRVGLILKTGSIYQAAKQYNATLGLTIFVKGTTHGKLRTSHQGLGTWVVHPILRGILTHGRGKHGSDDPSILKTFPGRCDTLFEPGEYQAIREMMQRNYLQIGDSGGRSLFAGMTRCRLCGCCGAYRQWWTSKGEERRVYHCKKRSVGTCENKEGISEEKIRDAMVAALVQKAKEIVRIESDPAEIVPTPEIINLNNQLSDLGRIPSPSSPISKAIAEIRSQIEFLQNEQFIEQRRDEIKAKELVEAFSDPLFWTDFVESRLTTAEIRAYYLKWIKVAWFNEGEIVEVVLKI
jgi:hypothetical protein